MQILPVFAVRKSKDRQYNGEMTTRTKGQTTIYKTLHKYQLLNNTNLAKLFGERVCFGRISNYSSTSNIRRPTVKRHEHHNINMILDTSNLT
jgi:hypothetical protein